MADIEKCSVTTEDADASLERTSNLNQSKGDTHASAAEEESVGRESVPQEVADKPQLSKNQVKKQRKRQEWEDARGIRKAVRKEKRVKTRERKRSAIRNGEVSAESFTKPHVQSELVPITVLIDCQFEHEMTPAELVSMGSQLTRCYADHRKAPYRTHLAVSSFDGVLKARFEGILNNQHKSWDVKFRQHHFVDVAAEASEWMRGPKGGTVPASMQDNESPSTLKDSETLDDNVPAGEVVYLTSDSPNTLQVLKPYSTYIIGGIVDKNRHKGICYQRACDHNTKTARLPIGEYIKLSSRHVMATNHVHEIMLKWLEYRDWGKAFMAVIPQRKGGALKEPTVPGDDPDSSATVAEEGHEDGFREAER
ncbi:MAG: hypothetical protein Q9162_003601 [Coniocarpon cinnabarinum]